MQDREELDWYRVQQGKKTPDEIRKEISRLEDDAKKATTDGEKRKISEQLAVARQELDTKTDGKREGDAVHGGRLIDRPKDDEWPFPGGAGSKKTTIQPGSNGELDPQTGAPTGKRLFAPNPFLPKVDLKTGEGLDATPKTEPPKKPKLEDLWAEPAADPAPEQYDDGHAWSWKLKNDKDKNDKKDKPDKIPDARKTKRPPKPKKKTEETTSAVPVPPPPGTFVTASEAGARGDRPPQWTAPDSAPREDPEPVDPAADLVADGYPEQPEDDPQEAAPSNLVPVDGQQMTPARPLDAGHSSVPSSQGAIPARADATAGPLFGKVPEPDDDLVNEIPPSMLSQEGRDELNRRFRSGAGGPSAPPREETFATADQPTPLPYDITKDLAPAQPAVSPRPSSEFGPSERQRTSALGCLMALLWLDDADDDELPAPVWILRAAVVAFVVTIGVVGWLVLGRTQVGSAVSPSAPTVRLRSLAASDLPRVVIQPSQAPAGMSSLSDSGAKTLQTGWRDLSTVQQALSDDGFNASYVAHFGLPTVSDGQVVSRITLFNDPAGATKAIGTLAKLQATVANVQPSPAPSVATDAQTVQAQLNGFGLYAFYWTRGNALLDVLLQGRQANVSADDARSLVDKMNANYDAAASAPAASVAASASGACEPAPDVALTFTGSTSGTATKGCLPIGRPGPSAAPYCRLDGIPAKLGANAGVLDARVAFTLNATRWDLNITYTATTRDPNGGTLPVTLRAGAGARATLIANQSGTSSGTFFNLTGGEYTIDADGSTGTIDADFTSTNGLPLHLKGTWKVAGGCPRTG